MAFVKRFGGWRPVQMEEGTGVLRLADGGSIDAVAYRFEVWHQMVDGFPGPFRSEGELSADPEAGLPPSAALEAVLELGDGRSLPVRVFADGSMLAHARPTPAETPAASRDV